MLPEPKSGKLDGLIIGRGNWLLVKKKSRERLILLDALKVAFFQKVQFVFEISKFPKKDNPKNYPELEI